MTSGGKPGGGLAGKLMLSGALILASGAYAWRMETQQNVPAASKPALPRLMARPLPAAAPMAEAQPQAPPMAQAVPQRLLPARAPEDGDVARMQAPEAPPPGEIAPAPQSGAAPEAPEKPAVPASNAPPAPAPQKAARYADGEYIGQPADAVWGLIQVKAEIRGGVITGIACIDYPNHRRRSVQINDWALPLLEQEAIATQSAEIDIVTQATTTSVGYRQTLATALAQARP